MLTLYCEERFKVCGGFEGGPPHLYKGRPADCAYSCHGKKEDVERKLEDVLLGEYLVILSIKNNMSGYAWLSEYGEHRLVRK